MKKRILSLLALFCGFFASTSAVYGGNEPPKQTNDNYLTFTNNSTNDIQISLAQTGTPYTISLVYSTDNASTWSGFEVKTNYTIEAGKSLKIAAGSEGTPGKKINIGFSKDGGLHYYNFVFKNSSGAALTNPVVSISGDVTSLLNGVGGDVDLSSNDNYKFCFYKLFDSVKCITSAPNLPSNKLANGCYGNMFHSCTSLVSAPNLPALTLAQSCYYAMFQGCSSLVSAPNLPATDLYKSCYFYMFSGCSSLVKIPDLSHINSLSSQDPTSSSHPLYCMFYNCIKLTITAATPETGNWAIGTTGTTGDIALSIFKNCTGVTITDKLPVKGTKYYLGLPGVYFEITSLAGYYTKGSNKQAMCAFGATTLSDNLASITEFGFAVYNGTSYEDTIKTTDVSKIDELTKKGGRFYTIINCDGAGVIKKVKAYAKIGDKRYDSSEISATSNLDNEYSI